MTLARRHFQRTSAAQASASAEPGAPVNANAYELQLIALQEHQRRLKQLQSIERKIEYKRGVIPEFQPWVTGALASGRGGQDMVLMTLMVWSIDVGQYADALRIAHYAIEHDLSLPDKYQRDVPTLVAEEIAEQALAALGSGGSFDGHILAITAELTAKQDMPDEVRAKLHKAMGLQLVRAMGETLAQPTVAEAIEHLRRAVQLNERVGVKKEIERLERFQKNHAAKSQGVATPESSITAGEGSALADASALPPAT